LTRASLLWARRAGPRSHTGPASIVAIVRGAALARVAPAILAVRDAPTFAAVAIVVAAVKVAGATEYAVGDAAAARAAAERLTVSGLTTGVNEVGAAFTRAARVGTIGKAARRVSTVVYRLGPRFRLRARSGRARCGDGARGAETIASIPSISRVLSCAT